MPVLELEEEMNWTKWNALKGIPMREPESPSVEPYAALRALVELSPEVELPVEEQPKLTISYILEGAAKLLTGPGKWVQGRSYRDGAHCAAGAMIETVAPDYYRDDYKHQSIAQPSMQHRKLYRSALDFVSRVVLHSPDTGALVRFNDRVGTTQEQVIAVLQTGAELARQRGL
jgi:hypothetical protein